MLHAPDSAQAQLAAALAPLPQGLSTGQLEALQQTSPSPEPGIGKTQQLLAQLLQLKPDWAVSFGDRLVQQALTLWPEEAKPRAALAETDEYRCASRFRSEWMASGYGAVAAIDEQAERTG